MKYYLLSDRCAYLSILITGGMKPEYYIRKIIYDLLLFLTKLKMDKNDPYSGPSFLATKISIIEGT